MHRRACLAALLAALPVAEASRQLRAGLIDVPPWGWAKPGQLCGAYAEWLVQFGYQLGETFQLELRPLARVGAELKSGRLDFALMTEQPFLDAHSLGKVTELDLVLLGDVDRGGRVGVLRGVALPVALQSPKWERVDLQSVRSQVEMLRIGRLQAAVGVRQSFEATVDGAGARELLATARPVETRSVQLWIGTHLLGTTTAAKMKGALKRMQTLISPTQLLEWPSCRPHASHPTASRSTQ